MANAESQNIRFDVGITAALNVEPTNYEVVEPTSIALSPNISSTQSAAIRAGRTPPEQIRTDADGRGDIGQELQDQACEIFIQGAMQNAWGSEADIVLASASITTAGVLTAASGTPFASVAVGDCFYYQDTTNPSNNCGVIVINKASSTVITLSKKNGKLFTVTTLGAVTLNRNGIISISDVRRWLWIQKFFRDGAGTGIESEMYKNASVNTLSFSFTPGQIATLSCGVISAFPSIAAVTQWATATLRAGTPFQHKPMNGLDNVRAIVEDINGTPNVLPDSVTELTLEINNNVAADSVVGQFGAVQTRLGQAIVTGTLNAFLYDTSLITKVINETKTSLAFVVDDAAGGALGFKLGNVLLTTLGTPVNGPGDVVLQQLGFNATQLSITRING